MVVLAAAAAAAAAMSKSRSPLHCMHLKDFL